MNKNLVKIAIITDAHGIKGEVKLRIFVENPDFFTDCRELFDETGRIFRIKITGEVKNSLIAKIENIQDRNAAELLKNKELFAPSSYFPETDDGEFYRRELIGLKARLENGKIIGKVTAIHNYGAGDILEIEKETGESEMLPFSEPWIKEINTEQGYVTVTPPDYI